jgi:hypothetical protein
VILHDDLVSNTGKAAPERLPLNFWPRFLRLRRGVLPELFAGSEEGFVDTSLRIVQHRRLADGGHTFHVRAKAGEATVGFVIEVSADWRPDTLGDSIPVFRGSVRYRSLGAESNAFVRQVAQAYGRPADDPVMPQEIQFAAIALSGNPMTFEGGKVNMKLFYEPENEDLYAEVYTNLNPNERLAEFREKDEGYRENLIRALGAVAA